MKITKEQFKKIVKEVLTEENEYQAFFAKALEKSGKSIPDMSDEEKKAFFDKIDSAWQGKGEKSESVNEASVQYLKPGTRVKLRGGKSGKIVRFDGKTPGSPFYIVDIGQYYSIEVPADQIKTESVKEAELTAGQKKLDVDGDGDIEGDDLADLRAGKKANEATQSGSWVGFTKTPKGKKYHATFSSGKQAEQWAIKNNGGAMPKSDWDSKEAKYAVK